MKKLHNAVRTLFKTYHFPGHDFKHVLRVSRLARQIAAAEKYDLDEAEIAGLLHDVGRTVKDPIRPHAHEGVPIARELLDMYTDFSEEAKLRILESIEKHSDKYTEGKLNQIVQDADKLDGMGAIGISRALYVSAQTLPDYDPEDILPKPGGYGKCQTATELIAFTMEWYGMLYTDYAKTLGKRRFELQKAFLTEMKQDIEEAV